MYIDITNEYLEYLEHDLSRRENIWLKYMADVEK